MCRTGRFLYPCLLVGASILTLAIPAGARPVWTPAFDRGVFQVEIMKPALESDPDLSFPSSITFLSVSVPLQPGLNFVGDLPFSYVDSDYGKSSSTLGNPHVGVEYQRPGEDLAVEVGVRLPLVDEDEASAMLYGLYGDLSRWEAWVDKAVPFNLTAHVQTLIPSGFGFRFDGGSVLWISTEDDIDSEVFAVYAVQLVYVGEEVRVNTGFNGRALLSEDDFDLGRDTMHELGMSACFRAGTVWPGLTIRVPLDEDYSEIVEQVVAVQVSFELD